MKANLLESVNPGSHFEPFIFYKSTPKTVCLNVIYSVNYFYILLSVHGHNM